MEGDLAAGLTAATEESFQSTPSAWRETLLSTLRIRIERFQSTPSAWRETAGWLRPVDPEIFQSTPSAWRETAAGLTAATEESFQSTPSAWRETQQATLTTHGKTISIHSLRMEGDRWWNRNCPVSVNFNPLPPHGGRRVENMNVCIRNYFRFFCKCWGRRKQRSFGKNQMRTAF